MRFLFLMFVTAASHVLFLSNVQIFVVLFTGISKGVK